MSVFKQWFWRPVASQRLWCFVLSVASIALGSQGSVLAITQNQLNVFTNGIYMFNTEAYDDCSTTNGTVVGNTQGLGPSLEGHSLPAASGGLGLEEAAVISNGRAVLAPGTSHPGASLSLAPAGMTQRDADFYINMRWRYAVWAWNGTSSPGPEQASWYSQQVRKVKVTNTTNGKSVVASVLESGPAPYTGTKEGQSSPPSYWSGYVDGTPAGYDGRVAGLSPQAFAALSSPGLEWTNGGGDKVNFEWVDSSVEAGTVSSDGVATAASGSTGSGCTTANADFTSHFTFYNQYDPKWKDHPFGASNIGDSGCGPTSVAMVVSNLSSQSVTPDQVADFGTQNGGAVKLPGGGIGSSYQKMLVDGPEHYGLKVTPTTSITQAMTAMQNGALVIAAGTGAVPYTTSGHIIVLRAVSGDGKILIADPDGAHTNADSTEFSVADITTGNTGLWIVTKN